MQPMVHKMHPLFPVVRSIASHRLQSLFKVCQLLFTIMCAREFASIHCIVTHMRNTQLIVQQHTYLATDPLLRANQSFLLRLQIDGEVRDRILIAVEDYARVLAPDEFRKAYDTLLVSFVPPSSDDFSGFSMDHTFTALRSHCQYIP